MHILVNAYLCLSLTAFECTLYLKHSLLKESNFKIAHLRIADVINQKSLTFFIEYTILKYPSIDRNILMTINITNKALFNNNECTSFITVFHNSEIPVNQAPM